MKGDNWPIVGYVDRLSVAQGGTLDVMVSTDRESYSASMVRLGGAKPEPVTVLGAGVYRGRSQSIFTGSFVAIPNSPVFDGPESLTIRTWIYPTMPGIQNQGIVTKWSGDDGAGWGLYIDEAGALTFQVGFGGSVVKYSSSKPLRARTWYQVACTYHSSSGLVHLSHEAVSPWREPAITESGRMPAVAGRIPINEVPLLIGAGQWNSNPRPHASASFDGKIENPSIAAGKKVLASWDFSIGITSAMITDVSPNRLHGTAVNLPMRAATGRLWDTRQHRFNDAPAEYAAIHFHSDDLEDAGWERDFTLHIPAALASGAYAVRLEVDNEADEVPFFVTPASKPEARIVVLAPTFTYLAYANEHFWSGTGTMIDGPSAPDPSDLFVAAHPEVGRGLYDRHVDGSGCTYASRLRPLVNMRSGYRSFRSGKARNFSADLQLLQWLERKGFKYDVVSDEELHSQGVDALSGYGVVITGSHPEYYTAAMLDAVGAYLDGGGKLMYLGGNGFYWVTSVAGDRRQAIEVRRGTAGTRTWGSEPGELYHSSTGELGGLWRHRGRPPNLLVGVGFSAMGDGSCGYHQLGRGLAAEGSFALNSVDPDEVIGEFGAAGDEVDRYDVELGSPPSAVILASATDFDSTFVGALEEQLIEDRDELRRPLKRADMVYFELPSGGGVFSIGSINWIVSLGFSKDKNNVSTITENVLRHFVGASTERLRAQQRQHDR